MGSPPPMPKASPSRDSVSGVPLRRGVILEGYSFSLQPWSIMGTILLIYFTLSIGKLNGNTDASI
ncbi:hypothetical protein CASFOL_028934 [Castilleja foliolosa]|uniref:Uncharacterized protein n=1 Tax=Castilleja foliolosa TaxID=1961234 RepID=A0ABD3CE14_9LAMI